MGWPATAPHSPAGHGFRRCCAPVSSTKAARARPTVPAFKIRNRSGLLRKEYVFPICVALKVFFLLKVPQKFVFEIAYGLKGREKHIIGKLC